MIKFLIKSLQRALKENVVKSDDVVLRRFIEEYLNRDTEMELDDLKQSLIHDRNPIVP